MSRPLSRLDADTALIQLILLARDGDDDSAREFYERCRAPLLMAIRPLMTRSLSRIYDPADFLNETITHVCLKQFQQKVLECPDKLLPYLKGIAKNMVRRARRRLLENERSCIARDIALEDSPDLIKTLITRDLGPYDSLCMKEWLEAWRIDFFGKRPPVYQFVVSAWTSGDFVADIAARTNLSARRVYYMISCAADELEDSMK